MTEQLSTNRRHIATLDLLRLLAALAVVLFHYLFRGAAAEPYLDAGYPEAASFAIYGYLGVNLFFLISGFVIAWSAEGSHWAGFAAARFTRLYPGFLICMTGTFVVLSLAAPPLLPVSLAQYGANLVMLAPGLGQPFMDGVYWSIVLEVIFYGWVAVALLLGVFQRAKLLLVFGWLLVSALNELVIGSGALRLVFVTEFAPFFAAGILVHHIHARGAAAGALLLAAAAFGLSCYTLTVGQAWMQAHYGTAVPMTHLLLANTAIHAMLILAVRHAGLVKPSAFLFAVGGLTYPLYLLHQNIGYVAINQLAPDIGRWPAGLAVVLAMLVLSWAVWRFAEKPCQRVLRRLLDRMTGDLVRPGRLPGTSGATAKQTG
ncbi:MAG: acyltransferase [Mesorhizobium sp. SCN 65-20]|nr:MAG: acyltransferase [Mesorhizobium sp. SCN 65-20]